MIQEINNLRNNLVQNGKVASAIDTYFYIHTLTFHLNFGVQSNNTTDIKIWKHGVNSNLQNNTIRRIIDYLKGFGLDQ